MRGRVCWSGEDREDGAPTLANRLKNLGRPHARPPGLGRGLDRRPYHHPAQPAKPTEPSASDSARASVPKDAWREQRAYSEVPPGELTRAEPIVTAADSTAACLIRTFFIRAARHSTALIALSLAQNPRSQPALRSAQLVVADIVSATRRYRTPRRRQWTGPSWRPDGRLR